MPRLPSFIYEDFGARLLKQAQEAPVPAQAPPADPKAVQDIALKFLGQLQANQNTLADQFTAEKTSGAALSTKHLVSLPALLNFLETNGIAANGHPLVLSHGQQAFSSGVRGDADFAAMDKNDQALYAPYPKGTENFQYRVFKAGLLTYLEDLQQKAAGNDPGAQVLRPYVSRLMQQAEQELDLSSVSKETTDAEKAHQAKTPGEQAQNGADKSNGGRENGQGGITNVSWHPGEPLSGEQMKMLAPITSSYPFLPDRIDFNLVDRWVSMFLSIMQSFSSSDVNLQNAQMAKQYAQSIMGTWGMTQQSLTDTAEEIYQGIKSKAEVKQMEENAAAYQPRSYLDYVAKMVWYLQNTLLDFKSRFLPSMPAEWQQIEGRKLDDQVSDSGSSLGYRTKATVQQWINNLPSVETRLNPTQKRP